MKNILTIIIAMLLAVATFAQSVPQTVNFSATVRDANNELLANIPVNVKLTFYEGGENGTPVYCALYQTTTNDFGFMSFLLNRDVLAFACNGAPNTPFEEIPWENGNFWMQVEYQTEIMGDFVSLGYLELTSGFYAFSSNYALVAQKLEGFDIDVSNAQDGDILVYNGTTRKWEARRPESIGDNNDQQDTTPYSPPTGFKNGRAYVDLGLPSGTVWAYCNIGANSPTDAGDYYAWGETSPKETYGWSNYRYCNGTYESLTKYCTELSWMEFGNDGYTDTLTTLEASDDAATVNWGSDWRMPTEAEINELRLNCEWEPLDDGINVIGYIITGPNGNSIVLPFTGYYKNSEIIDEQYSGHFWSSSLDSQIPYTSRCIYFQTSYIQGINTDYRCYGLTVRPVCSIDE